jgi:hypothetical protein
MKRILEIITAGAIWCLFFSLAAAEEAADTADHVTSATLSTSLAPLEAVWPRGEVREYLFEIAGREVGRQWNQMTVTGESAAESGYRLNFTLDLDLRPVGQPTQLRMDGNLDLSSGGRPVAYQLNVTIDGQEQKLTALFLDEEVQAVVLKGGKESRHQVQVSRGIWVVDNNMIGQWGLMLALFPLQPKAEVAATIFVPQALMEMDILVEVTDQEPVEILGAEELAHVCDISPIGETCLVTEGGRLVRLEDEKQDLVVTLLPPGEIEARPEKGEDGRK